LVRPKKLQNDLERIADYLLGHAPDSTQIGRVDDAPASLLTFLVVSVLPYGHDMFSTNEWRPTFGCRYIAMPSASARSK
jgi:hypothetical protein